MNGFTGKFGILLQVWVVTSRYLDLVCGGPRRSKGFSHKRLVTDSWVNSECPLEKKRGRQESTYSVVNDSNIMQFNSEPTLKSVIK